MNKNFKEIFKNENNVKAFSFDIWLKQAFIQPSNSKFSRIKKQFLKLFCKNCVNFNSVRNSIENLKLLETFPLKKIKNPTKF